MSYFSEVDSFSKTLIICSMQDLAAGWKASEDGSVVKVWATAAVTHRRVTQKRSIASVSILNRIGFVLNSLSLARFAFGPCFAPSQNR
jgi:hypothetical protein